MEENNNMLNDRPKKYLILAIIATLFFWPLGIVAIIKSLKVDDYLAMNNPEMAFYASKDAKRFSVFAIVVGLIGWLMIVGVLIFAFTMAAFSA